MFFYHSNADPPPVVGVTEVVREAYPDETSWDRHDLYYDPKSTPDRPRWYMVDLRLVRVFAHPLSLDPLRHQSGLARMELLRKGSRVSVQPVRPEEWKIILDLASGTCA